MAFCEVNPQFMRVLPHKGLAIHSTDIFFVFNLSKSEQTVKLPWFETLTLLSDVMVSHYCDVIMGVIASQITSLAIVFSTVYSDADQRKHQSSASLAFVRGIHWGPGNVSIWWCHHAYMIQSGIHREYKLNLYLWSHMTSHISYELGEGCLLWVFGQKNLWWCPKSLWTWVWTINDFPAVHCQAILEPKEQHCQLYFVR